MADRYVDDAGDNTDGTTWAKAYTSINALITAEASFLTTSGNRVFFGSDSQCQATNSANLTITGPTSGLPVQFISATVGSSPPTYAVGTGNQIDTTEGAYQLIFDGSFTLHGMRLAAGSTITFTADTNENMVTYNCTLSPPANGSINSGGAMYQEHHSLIVDLTADGTTNRTSRVFEQNAGYGFFINGLSFINAAYRTGNVFDSLGNGCPIVVTGADFSGFTNATPCEILNPQVLHAATFTNCKTAATWTPLQSSITPGTTRNAISKFINCGNGDQPISLIMRTAYGDIVSSSSIYRAGGATIEATPTAWLITTTATCSYSTPFYSEYITGRLAATGSKTFDLYVTNDTADLTDEECWLEIEYKAASGSGAWTKATDRKASITATAANQTDDVTSTWNGSGPAFTYKQKLSVTVTVGEVGQYRARVAVGKTSVGSASYLYIDPKVTVS